MKQIDMSKTMCLKNSIDNTWTVFGQDDSIMEPDMDGFYQPDGCPSTTKDLSLKNEEVYEKMIEIVPDAVVLTNLDGKVTACNQRAATLYRLDSPDESLDEDSFRFISPEDRARAAEHLYDVYETGLVANLECTLLKKDGTRFPAEVSTSLLRDETGLPSGFMNIVRDISHIQSIEQTWADFVHALSHDLKSPLSSIKGWAEMLQRGDTLDSRSSQFVGRIVGASDTTLAMIEQLLDVASLTEAPKLRLGVCDLKEVVARAIDDLDGAALVRSLNVRLRVIGKPFLIIGDESRLYRSVLNLLDNAIKYSLDETQISVTLAYEAKCVTLKIHDGGLGIPDSELPYIFEKYYRGTYASSSKSGAGLGLATVHAVVQAHNGAVTVKNCYGGGAEFTVVLPANQA